MIYLGINEDRNVSIGVELNESKENWRNRQPVVIASGYITKTAGTLTIHEDTYRVVSDRALIFLNSTSEPAGPMWIENGKLSLAPFRGVVLARAKSANVPCRTVAIVKRGVPFTVAIPHDGLNTDVVTFSFNGTSFKAEVIEIREV